MPVPIIPQNVDFFNQKDDSHSVKTEYNQINIDDLARSFTERSVIQNKIKVSSFEAGLLFKLWKDSSSSSSEEEFEVPSVFTNDDILRLKASGLLSGNTERVKMTPKGKEVIKTMVLTESNKFDKSSSNKTYNQRKSETRILGGPRLSVNKKK